MFFNVEARVEELQKGAVEDRDRQLQAAKERGPGACAAVRESMEKGVRREGDEGAVTCGQRTIGSSAGW